MNLALLFPRQQLQAVPRESAWSLEARRVGSGEMPPHMPPHMLTAREAHTPAEGTLDVKSTSVVP